ncbi:MAG: HAMP domain-containing sensor histidine kinase [Haloarculaceae archaeon]
MVVRVAGYPLIIGSIGGLLIGIQDTRASIRTDQLEDRTRELAQRERSLERQNEQLEEFASIVSHDLRNPLSVATGRLELARADCDSEHLDRIADAHGRMGALIDDLLTPARQGEGIRRPEAVDLAALSERCWQHVATDGATLVAATDRTIRADRDRLQQLLENLVPNAVEQGSTSSRTQSGDEVVTVTIGDLEDGRRFYLGDDGSGIPEGERERVFESGYSTSTEGTGFGLAIVREIVDAHDWDVRVTDGPAGGARFEITGVEFEE